MPKPVTLKARKKRAFHSRKKSPLGQEHGWLPGKMKGLPQKERLVLEGEDEGRAETKSKPLIGVKKYKKSAGIANVAPIS